MEFKMWPSVLPCPLLRKISDRLIRENSEEIDKLSFNISVKIGATDYTDEEILEDIKRLEKLYKSRVVLLRIQLNRSSTKNRPNTQHYSRIREFL
jgi:hypothetical protein